MTSRLLVADATIDNVRRETVAQQVHCRSIDTLYATIRREPTTLPKAFIHPFVGVSKFHIRIYLLFWDICSKQL